MSNDNLINFIFSAGCEIISTNTYQASVDGFQKYLNLDRQQSLDLIKEAVVLARKAVNKSVNGM